MIWTYIFSSRNQGLLLRILSFFQVTPILEIFLAFYVRELLVDHWFFLFSRNKMIALIASSISLIQATKFCLWILPFFCSVIWSTKAHGLIFTQGCRWLSMILHITNLWCAFILLLDWFQPGVICSIKLLIFYFLGITATSKYWLKFSRRFNG